MQTNRVSSELEPLVSSQGGPQFKLGFQCLKAFDARKADVHYLPPRPTRLRANPRHLWGTVRVVKQYL